MVAGIGNALHFMETLAGEPIPGFQRAEFYTSHEALLLHYEQALTRQVPRQWGWFDLSSHFPWIGMRTAALDGAHVEYLRGIRNPVAVKVGPAMARRSAACADRSARSGRRTRPPDVDPSHGRGRNRSTLPGLIEAAKSAGRRVLWCCDPMHGNTETLGNGTKTRRFAEHPCRARTGVRHPRRARHAPRRRASRVDRRERHRMHRRCARSFRERPDPRLQVHGRSAPQLRAVAGTGDADRAQARWCAGSRLGGPLIGLAGTSEFLSAEIVLENPPRLCRRGRRGRSDQVTITVQSPFEAGRLADGHERPLRASRGIPLRA